MNNPTYYAVLNGDIVRSTRLSTVALQAALDALRHAIAEFGSIFPDASLANVEFFRGDAFQLSLNPQFAFRLALLLQARLCALQGSSVRISIGFGTAGDTGSGAHGEAFVLSGRALDKIGPYYRPYYRLTAAAPERSGALSTALPIVSHLCDSLSRRWKPATAEKVAVALLTPSGTQAEIALRLDRPVSQQVVSSALSAAGWRPLEEVLNWVEALDWSLTLQVK
jgi:hypothetical protein